MNIFSLLTGLCRRPAHRAVAQSLYAAVVAQARSPFFYRSLQVPDSVDGRFDMLALHLFLLLDRLRGDRQAQGLSQALVDMFVQDMDVNLREMGVGDLSVGKRVRKHAAAFYGRLDAYRAAMETPDAEALVQAICRNVYRGVDQQQTADAARLAAYMRNQAAQLAGQNMLALMQGQVCFLPPS